MTLDRPRLTPYHWWGDAWAKPNPQSLDHLVDAGMLDQVTGNTMVNCVVSGQSVVVCSEASGVGKSTLAHALIDYCPPDRERIYIRGNHELFNWQGTIEPALATLLVNEISPHLPVYLWGPALKTVLTMGKCGAQIIATAHANSLDELRSTLCTPANGMTPDDVVALGLVVVINDVGHESTEFGRVSQIEAQTTAAVGIQTLPG